MAKRGTCEKRDKYWAGLKRLQSLWQFLPTLKVLDTNIVNSTLKTCQFCEPVFMAKRGTWASTYGEKSG